MIRRFPGACGAVLSVTVNVTPPTTIAPVWLAVFAPAENVTVPEPLPLAPEVTVSHALLLVAAQVQLAPVVTVKLPVPPVSGIVCDVGDSVYAHGAG